MRRFICTPWKKDTSDASSVSPQHRQHCTNNENCKGGSIWKIPALELGGLDLTPLESQ